MSLEAALLENTAALKELAAELQASRAERKDLLDKVGAGALAQAGAPVAEKPATRRGRPAKEPTAGPVEATDAKPAPVATTKPDAAPAATSATFEGLRDAAQEFLGIVDPDAKVKRREFVTAVMDELGVDEVDG